MKNIVKAEKHCLILSVTGRYRRIAEFLISKYVLSRSNTYFFFYLVFLSQPFTNHRTAGEGEDISLTPHYHFHLLHRHLNVSRAITVERSPLHIGSKPDSNQEPLFVGRKSLTTKLRVTTSNITISFIIRSNISYIKPFNQYLIFDNSHLFTLNFHAANIQFYILNVVY